MKKFLALCLCLAAGAASGTGSLAAQIGLELQQPAALTAAGDDHLLLPYAVTSVYAGRSNLPIWTSEQGPLPPAWEMLAAIRAAEDDALHPDDYHLRSLLALFASVGADSSDADRQPRLAALDLLLSDAFLLLSEHELNGRVSPADLDPLLTRHLHDGDPAANLAQVAGGAEPDRIIRSMAPQNSQYAALRAALFDYRVIAAAGGFASVPDGAPLRLGSAGPRVQDLMERLRLEGDLTGQAPSQDVFDEAVATAVRRFQARHGLDASGVVDAATLAALNVPIRARIDQLRVNMERLRWLPQRPAATRVVVNIASFRAALFQDGVLRLTEAVVVGTPFRQTPEFSDRIQYLVVNPTWDVPASIAGEDLLPRLQADSRYLAAHGYQVVEGWGDAEHPVASDGIDWSPWTADDLPYRLRQLPGPENPLGRVKFMFPNRFGVYLHDTPAQGLFAEGSRAFSSGCIRVAHATDLAEMILLVDGRPDAHEQLQKALAAGVPQQIPLQHPLPIYIVYFTAWADETGTLQFRNDVYDRDTEILRALDTPLGQVMPAAAQAIGGQPRKLPR